MTEWQSMDTAPKGSPTEDVGSRSSSEWFKATRKDGDEITIRRASSYVGHDWEDREETYYTDIKEPWFTQWHPLSLPCTPQKGSE